jgi:hypothetical protein
MERDWKIILMPYYDEVRNKISKPDMRLNIYSRWIGEFIGWANTFTSEENLIEHGFMGFKVNTNDDLKDQFVIFLKEYC